MRVRDVDWQTVLVAGLGTATVLALLVGASTSSAAFGPFNAGWDGSSKLAEQAAATGAETRHVTDVERYGTRSPDGTVSVVLSPDEPYGSDDAAAVRAFVRAGGTLVVADDFGAHSNALLEAVGAEARVDGRVVRDEYSHYRSPSLPVATNVTDAPLVSDVDSLTLNYGSYVRPNGASVLVSTSEYAYVDQNRNRAVEPTEPVRSFPVVTVESVGDGRVVVVSDPSILLNAMLERPGNRAFAQAMFAGQETVYLDYSHRETLPPLAASVLALRESAFSQLLVGALCLGVLARWGDLRALATRLFPGRDSDVVPPGGSREAVVDYLLDRHPDWEAARVRRLVDALRRDGDEPG